MAGFTIKHEDIKSMLWEYSEELSVGCSYGTDGKPAEPISGNVIEDVMNWEMKWKRC